MRATETKRKSSVRRSVKKLRLSGKKAIRIEEADTARLDLRKDQFQTQVVTEERNDEDQKVDFKANKDDMETYLDYPIMSDQEKEEKAQIEWSFKNSINLLNENIEKSL